MRSPADAADVGLVDLARIVWRSKLVIVLLMVVAAAAAFALDSSRTPLYSGTTQLLLTPQVSQVVTSVNGANVTLTSADVATAAKVISSSSNQKAAAALIHVRGIPGASVSESGTTDVVDVSVTSPDEAFAAHAANAYANAYIDGQRNQAVTSLEAAASQISGKISGFQAQIASIQKQIASMTGQPASSGGTTATTTASSNPAVAGLQSQEATLVQEQSTLQQQVTELQDNANLSSGGGQIVSPAVPSPTPVSPHKARDVLLAALIGIILGVGLALLREFLDDRIRSEADLETVLGAIPPIGLIPVVPEWARHKNNRNPEVITSGDQRSSAGEAYRSLRTSIQFLRLDQEIHSIVVTSPVANDGKTTTVANLAMTMAEAGQRIIVLSCDLRKPELHKCFDITNEIGFTSVILGEVSLQDALQSVPGHGNLRVLSAGPIPPNPSELLASKRCERVLTTLTEVADVVLIDTPPVLPVTDAAVLGSKVDATLLVVSASSTTKKEASRAVEILGRVNAKPVGVIVNRIPHGGRTFYYSYGYGYDYGDRSGSVPSRDGTVAATLGDKETTLRDDVFGGPTTAPPSRSTNGHSVPRTTRLDPDTGSADPPAGHP